MTSAIAAWASAEIVARTIRNRTGSLLADASGLSNEYGAGGNEAR
jgi:hypothetical protein